ncbi:MAG: ThuA domain-containing protein, partial [Opitutaceae bacterium]
APGGLWFDFLGLQSSRHGPQEPIQVKFTDSKHPITRGLTGWTTGKEELYNNVQPPSVYAAHRPLATGFQRTKNKKSGATEDAESVVVWTNEYGPKKARVFCTTLGHNNDTVADARYLDLLARGLLWAAGKLDDSGRPVAGFGPAGR